MKWAGHTARMEDGRSAFNILRGTPTGKTPLGRPTRRWQGNIRIDLKEMCVNTRIVIIWLRIDYRKALENAAFKLQVP